MTQKLDEKVRHQLVVGACQHSLLGLLIWFAPVIVDVCDH